MSNIFESALSDATSLENDLLGPSYPYYKNIKTPTQLGMGDGGSIQQLSSDIDGIIDYVEVLVSGDSAASATGKPLGNKFFLQTGAKCAPTECPNGESSCLVDRYIYVDNVPDGSIPFISSGLDINFTDFEGLIPGAMGNLTALNPFAILGAFTSGSNPPCKQITLQTIDVNNNVSEETNYVTLSDISTISESFCGNQHDSKENTNTNNNKFKGNKNKNKKREKKEKKLPNDIITQIYFLCLCILGIYFLYFMMTKQKK